MKKKNGIYRDLPNDEYHQKDGFYSSTTLKGALKGPQYFLDTYVNGSGPDMSKAEAALSMGQYLHIALLEPENLETECVVFPYATRRNKIWKEFKSDYSDKTVITLNELDKCADLIEAFNKSVVDLDGKDMVSCTKVFTGGDAELSLFTSLPGNDGEEEPVKVRADYIIETDDLVIIRDLKTTSKEANTAYGANYICNSFNYYLSAALYVDAFSKHYGKPAVFELVFLSKSDYNTNIFRVSEEKIEQGRKDYKDAISKIQKWRTFGYREGLRIL